MSKLLSGSFSLEKNVASVSWLSPTPFDIVGKLSEEGRGMELSELVLFGDSLFSFDDRSGVVYELVGKLSSNSTAEEGKLRKRIESNSTSLRSFFSGAGLSDIAKLEIQPLARAVLPEGDGEVSPKGMKIEWATEKDGVLFVGSFGKEFTTPDGKVITGTSNFWVVSVADPASGSGIERYDWTANYQALRKATGTEFPGYMIHEAVNWSPVHRKWFFLPRRMSIEPYDEMADEKRGASKILIVSEDFLEISIVDVQLPGGHPERGFSSFKFVPGTGDRVIVALRSAESEEAGTQSTFLSVFDIDGRVITPEEVEVSPEFKYEGIEIW